MGNYPRIPDRLRAVDELTIALKEHACLSVEDRCCYLWERVTAGRYDQYPTNQLIKNLQIENCHKGTTRWHHKTTAIRHAISALEQMIPPDWKQICTFVPVPPSVPKYDDRHDSRILDILNGVRNPRLDVRELVMQTEEIPSKQKDIRPEDRAKKYLIDSQFLQPTPKWFVVFDDVLAGGSHFKAMQIVLQDRFPNTTVWGLFLARAIRPILSVD